MALVLTEAGASANSGFELTACAGLGMDGILDDSSDGLVFVEAGVRDDTHAIGAATVPGRGDITARLRMPFWLVPGDLAVAAPVLAFTSPAKLQKMLVGAANGGLRFRGRRGLRRVPGGCSLFWGARWA